MQPRFSLGSVSADSQTGFPPLVIPGHVLAQTRPIQVVDGGCTMLQDVAGI